MRINVRRLAARLALIRPGDVRHHAFGVEAGFTPLEAISIATQNAARFIGANDWGTIQPGKLATLIVVDGRPDRGISQTRKVVSVYVKGRKIDRDSLQLARQGDPGFEPISPVDF